MLQLWCSGCTIRFSIGIKTTNANHSKKLILDGLQKCGLDVPVQPDGAFYVYIDVSVTGLSAMTFCERVLQEAHVALTPSDDFSEQHKQFVT